MIWLGRVNYKQSLKYQEEYRKKILESFETGSNYMGEILALEHPSVVTLGVRANASDVLKRNTFPVVSVKRGGKATVHSKGQLVIYPVLAFEKMGLKPKEFIGMLLRSIMCLLETYEINSYFSLKKPGVYTHEGKIAFIGCHFEQGISSHGLSLNVFNNLDDFSSIKICGIENLSMDTLSHHLKGEDFFSEEKKSFYLKKLAFKWYECWKECLKQGNS